MYVSHCSCAIAGRNQRIVVSSFIIICAPADSTTSSTGTTAYVLFNNFKLFFWFCFQSLFNVWYFFKGSMFTMNIRALSPFQGLYIILGLPFIGIALSFTLHLKWGFFLFLVIINISDSEPHPPKLQDSILLKFEPFIRRLVLVIFDHVPELFLRILVELWKINMVFVENPKVIYDIFYLNVITSCLKNSCELGFLHTLNDFGILHL